MSTMVLIEMDFKMKNVHLKNSSRVYQVHQSIIEI